MKRLKLLLAIVATLLFLSNTSRAQVSVNVNVGQPMWGPVGYTEVRYYYLPAVEAYYDTQSAMFIYYSSGAWVYRTSLPTQYRNYDLYNGYKVVLTDYRGTAPYINFGDHKKQYNRGYNKGYQKTIGDNPGKGNSKSGKSNGNSHGKKEKH